MILGLAAFLRLWSLGASGLSGDESVYAGQAAVLAGAHSYSRYFILVSRGNSNFLLFQEIVSVAFRIFGVNDVLARVIGAIFGLGLVVVVFAIGRLLYGNRAGLLAMFVLSISSYAIALARVALLDTCAAFLFAISALCFLLWERDAAEGSKQNRVNWYFAAFAATAVLGCEAKVTTVLLLPVAVLFLLITRYYRLISVAALWRGAVCGGFAMVPALLQMVRHHGVITAALQSSVNRTSPVPWTYYLRTLQTYEGFPALIGAIIAVLFVLWKRRKADLFVWIWLIVAVVFVQLYPLKAYNYLLLCVVPLALLCGAGIERAVGMVRVPVVRYPVAVGALLAAGAVVAVGGLAEATTTHVDHQVNARPNPGVRAAAAWLEANTPPEAGVMALSQGSAQYSLAFYAKRDSFPFGRFRLGTVLPGGRVVTPGTTPAGKLPLDWVTKYPNEYVQNGRVSYFVYDFPEQDDPSEQGYKGLHLTQRNYLALIQSYGGKLVYSSKVSGRDEVLIFQVTRREPIGHLSYRIRQLGVILSGSGFSANSTVTIEYHNKRIGSAHTNAEGRMIASVRYPARTTRAWEFDVFDPKGHQASANGLAAPTMADTLTPAGLVIRGTGFAPNTRVSVTYMGATIDHANVSGAGKVRATIHLPPRSGYYYRLRMVDPAGRVASVLGIRRPQISYVQTGARLVVRGANFNPDSPIVISYAQRKVGELRSDANGSFSGAVVITRTTERSERLQAVDAYGRGASASDLQPAAISIVETSNGLEVLGRDFDPHSWVVITHRQQTLGEVETDESGAFVRKVSIKTKSQWRVLAIDAEGRAASVVYRKPPPTALPAGA